LETEELTLLIDKYLSGNANAKEKAIVEKWYELVDSHNSDMATERIEQYKAETHQFLSQYIGQQKTADKDPERNLVRTITIYRWLGAAIVLFTLTTGLYFYYNKQANTHVAAINKPLINDAAPGGNKATLTLSGGRKLILTDAKNGIVATQGDIAINKTNDGEVIYTGSQQADAGQTDAPIYNTITTPVGGTYNLKLADGTEVWLNAASSIKYPVVFKGSERLVELTGEAYFEVAKNKAMPFRVKSAGQTVEVLGTHFNINSYSNEQWVKTTLMEGRVKVYGNGSSALLLPGQQSSYNALANQTIKVLDDVNLDEVMAWKNGKFYFAKADIENVMRQLERWYDVEAIYTGNRPTDHFNGKIPKNVNLSQVLKVLELSGVHFKIEGRKIIIR